MTAAQRATLEKLAGDAEHLARMYEGYPGEVATYRASSDALRAALGTCGNCDHYSGSHCSAPADGDLMREMFPFRYKLMPENQRCTGWTAKEGA